MTVCFTGRIRVAVSEPVTYCHALSIILSLCILHMLSGFQAFYPNIQVLVCFFICLDMKGPLQSCLVLVQGVFTAA